jgi:diguanylate cyclase (GGDEF)-like protein
MLITHREELCQLWSGQSHFTSQTVNYTLGGRRLDVLLKGQVLPGHEARWDRVLVSVEDITELERTRLRITHAEQYARGLFEHSPVSLWVEDFSAVKRLLDEARVRNWDLVLVALTDITARKKAEAYLEYLGKHDVLTKLRNRSFYGDKLNRLERKGPYPVTVVMADLNGLKRVNDQLGTRPATRCCDALLRRAGEVLAKAMEMPFVAARIGGDEFAILMPGTDERGGVTMIETVHKLVELNNQFYPGSPLSFSMGAATVQHGERLEDGVQRADLLMYEDKRAIYAEEEARARDI